MAPKPAKTNLSIRLTESVVFLRGSVESTVLGRRQQAETQPAMLRGLLSLTLLKPTKISSIEIDLLGKTQSSWPEGIGARRIEVTEEHKILSASTVFFDASTSSHSGPRRTRSVGPGLAVDRDEDEHEEDSGGHDEPSGSHPRWLVGEDRRFSADNSVWQRDVVSHSEDPPSFDDAMTPPYTPTPAATPRTSSGRINELPSTDPGHQLEEFRNALRSGLDTERSPPLHRENSDAYSSTASSFRDLPLSRRASNEEAVEYTHSPTDSPARSRSRGRLGLVNKSGSSTAASTAPTSPASHDETGPRGRHSARFSFAAVSNVLLDAVKDRVRSSSPRTRTLNGKTPSRDQSVERSVDQSLDRDTSRGRTREKPAAKEKENDRHKDSSTIARRLGEVIGHADDGAASGDGWKEFRKGTYTYPISFAIPANTPPTLHCDYGSVTYRLKATVHRPGTFTSKLTTSREVTLIACPGEDDLDESDNVVVQRQWETQMHYVIVISGRAFPIGSVIPLHLTFVPMSKIKIYRISAVLEERVDYYTQFKRIARSDITRRFELLSLKYPDKDGPPLLPLTTDYASSPLRGMVDFEFDASGDKDVDDVAAADLMGPGPWTLQRDLQLPTSCGRMHFTNKHRKSNIGITHVLKIVLRVERGDDAFLDPKTGKRKLFDIVVQTPIHILSCRCNREWTALPRYSSFTTETHTKTQSCMCAIKRRGSIVEVDDLMSFPAPSAADQHHANNHTQHDSGRTPAVSGNIHAPAAIDTPPLRQSQDWFHFHSRHSVAHVVTPGDSPGENGAPLTRAPSLAMSDTSSLYNRNTQFARLMAGEESELGEAPPRYDYVASAATMQSPGRS